MCIMRGHAEIIFTFWPRLSARRRRRCLAWRVEACALPGRGQASARRHGVTAETQRRTRARPVTRRSNPRRDDGRRRRHRLRRPRMPPPHTHSTAERADRRAIRAIQRSVVGFTRELAHTHTHAYTRTYCTRSASVFRHCSRVTWSVCSNDDPPTIFPR